MKNKKIPERSCIACGQIKAKSELCRIVKNSEGIISVDKTGKASGRGAYVCKSQECLDTLVKKHKLEKAFSCRIDGEVYDRIITEIQIS